MRLTAYDTFCLYMALKNHFSSKSYDFFKYGGKMRINKETFLNRKDRFQFQKLCRLYDDTQMKDFLVANFVQSNEWVGKLLDDDAAQVYQDFIKRQQSLSYNFQNEINNAFNKVSKVSDLFAVKSGEMPKIIELHMQGDVSIETLILLNAFVGFFNKFDEKMADDFIWPKLRMKCDKLRPFLNFDKEKIKNILKDAVDAHK